MREKRWQICEQKVKIPQGEWPQILAKYAGETIAQIGRDYGCTALAIRYIIRRSGGSRAEAVMTVRRRDGRSCSHGHPAPCTLHVVGEFVDAVDLPARASQPGATLRPLCFEYLGGTSAPAGWPRRKPGGESRL